MGLIACPDCGNMVSDRAAACPHCGCPADAFLNPNLSMTKNTMAAARVS